MRALLPFIACLMLVLAGWASVAHAAEAAGGSIAGIAITQHLPGDGDEVPADRDNALPHHHGLCHGHDLGTPAAAVAPLPSDRHARIRPIMVADALYGIPASMIPRPPRA